MNISEDLIKLLPQNLNSIWSKKLFELTLDSEESERMNTERMAFVSARKENWKSRVSEFFDLESNKLPAIFYLFMQRMDMSLQEIIDYIITRIANLEYGCYVVLRESGFDSDSYKDIIYIQDIHYYDNEPQVSYYKKSSKNECLREKIVTFFSFLIDVSEFVHYISGSTIRLEDSTDWWFLAGVEDAAHYVFDHFNTNADLMNRPFAHLTHEQIETINKAYPERITRNQFAWYLSIDRFNNSIDKILKKDLPTENLGATIHVYNMSNYELDGMFAKMYFAYRLGILNDFERELQMISDLKQLSQDTLMEWN